MAGVAKPCACSRISISARADSLLKRVRLNRCCSCDARLSYRPTARCDQAIESARRRADGRYARCASAITRLSCSSPACRGTLVEWLQRLVIVEQMALGEHVGAFGDGSRSVARVVRHAAFGRWRARPDPQGARTSMAGARRPPKLPHLVAALAGRRQQPSCSSARKASRTGVRDLRPATRRPGSRQAARRPPAGR